MRYLENVLSQIVIWTIAFSILNFLREYGHEIVRKVEDLDSLTWIERVQFQILLGVVSGTLFGSYAYLFNKFLGKRMSFGKTVMLGSIGYVVVIMTFIVVAFMAFGFFFDASINTSTISEYFRSGEFLVLIIYCLIVGLLIEFVSQMDKSLGPGNLVKMLSGKFYEPKEEERIFMFLDMRSSTTIAERLGHINYSQLVQDCFKDLDAVSPYEAEVYQYVGDEVVLTWEKEKGLTKVNAIIAYFAFCDRLLSKKKFYRDKYGIVPEFKAGVNLGKVIVAEVGEIKREIAYHGDTVNTAARIQSKCNEYNQNFLASSNFINEIGESASIKITIVGEELLRGKGEKTEIYSIKLLTDINS